MFPELAPPAYASRPAHPGTVTFVDADGTERPEPADQIPDWLKFAAGLSVFAVPLLAAAMFLLLYARYRMRPTADAQAQPSFHDLQEQDMALERERMRAFEDAVLGPQVNQGLQPEP